jgi:hypothetical protein
MNNFANSKPYKNQWGEDRNYPKDRFRRVRIDRDTDELVKEAMHTTTRNFEPPTIQAGTVGQPDYEIGPGVFGYAIEHDSKIYIPIVRSMVPCEGNVRRWLDTLSSRCVFPNVITPIFADMLCRRGYLPHLEHDESGDQVFVWIRQAMETEPNANH